jgi:hypothetical protein
MTLYSFSTGFGQQTVWPQSYCGKKARDRKQAWHELAMANQHVAWQALVSLGFTREHHPWRTLDRDLQDRMVTAYMANSDARGSILEHLDEIGVRIRVFSREVPDDELRDALIEDLPDEALTEVIAVWAARRKGCTSIASP